MCYIKEEQRDLLLKRMNIMKNDHSSTFDRQRYLSKHKLKECFVHVMDIRCVHSSTRASTRATTNVNVVETNDVFKPTIRTRAKKKSCEKRVRFDLTPSKDLPELRVKDCFVKISDVHSSPLSNTALLEQISSTNIDFSIDKDTEKVSADEQLTGELPQPAEILSMSPPNGTSSSNSKDLANDEIVSDERIQFSCELPNDESSNWKKLFDVLDCRVQLYDVLKTAELYHLVDYPGYIDRDCPECRSHVETFLHELYVETVDENLSNPVTYSFFGVADDDADTDRNMKCSHHHEIIELDSDTDDDEDCIYISLSSDSSSGEEEDLISSSGEEEDLISSSGEEEDSFS